MMLRYLNLLNKYTILKIKYEKLLDVVDETFWGDDL